MDCRLANTADLPELLVWMGDFNRIEGITWDAKSGTRALQRLLGSPEVGVVGYFSDSAVGVGYFVLTWGYDLEWNGRDAMLTELYLADTARGRGLGKKAMRFIDEIARKNGASALHLMVRRENEAAIRVYREARFKESPRLFLTKRIP